MCHSVVFSFWASSLDMVQQALQAAGIRCVRIDGKVAPGTRIRVLHEFKTDPALKVILMTTLCGAVGYVDLSLGYGQW